MGNKPQLIVVNRTDMVSKEDMARWQSYLTRLKVPVVWTNGKSGQGCVKVRHCQSIYTAHVPLLQFMQHAAAVTTAHADPSNSGWLSRWYGRR